MESTPEGSVTTAEPSTPEQPYTAEQQGSIDETQKITMQNAANPLAPVNPFTEKKGVMESLKDLLNSFRGKKDPPKNPDLPEPSV